MFKLLRLSAATAVMSEMHAVVWGLGGHVVCEWLGGACLSSTGHPFTQSNEAAFTLLTCFVCRLVAACMCDVVQHLVWALLYSEMVTSAVDVAIPPNRYDH